MATTRFYHFVVRFANATTPIVPDEQANDGVYRIVEVQPQHWAIFENEQPVALTETQRTQLVQLLAALQPPPDPSVAPLAPGCDGTWLTCVIQRGGRQTTYRWWVRPPDAWATLGELTQFVLELAALPRVQRAQRQRVIAQQFFSCLATHDLPGILELYHPTIQYRSPFLALHGAEVARMWQMWRHYLPDVRVAYTDSDIRNGFASWSAFYTYPPTSRRVTHHITTEFTFADNKITQHVDRFNVHEWAEQAYGALGGMIGGWQPFRWLLTSEVSRLHKAFRRTGQDDL